MTNSHNPPFNRRRFLTLSGSTALATGFAGAGILTIPRPAHAASHEWTLEVTRPADRVYQYNGKTTGPIISASAGETIVVNLVNAMSAIDDVCPADGNMNQEHGANVTNLHTHGLHVSPVRSDNGKFDSDNIFLRVVPDGQIVGKSSIVGCNGHCSWQSCANLFGKCRPRQNGDCAIDAQHLCGDLVWQLAGV